MPLQVRDGIDGPPMAAGGRKQNKANDISRPAELVAATVATVAVFGAWFALLFFGPAPTRSLLIAYPTLIGIVAGLAAVVLLATRVDPQPRTAGVLSLLALTLAVFGIPLLGMWYGGPSGPNILAFCTAAIRRGRLSRGWSAVGRGRARLMPGTHAGR